ncbi:MAG: imidazoleglycerol-phosphate dehydratase HisB [Actinobacteria bacterium]|jgi:imidazoleglycerol-phosphate dehydratase|nr:imidazoleglycerol-phosphate dehydratase HisB [Actinomycetota bacterium]MBU4314429.1 imidazoleglycerol-phosphate dehydratase HisB [Actinomycetota bacterium]
MKRKTKIIRKTKETNITLEFDLDGSGIADIETSVPFFNHILESFTRHGNFNMKLQASGDLEAGCHHLVEDVGICLGKAIFECLKNKKGIKRFGYILLPMDETEVTVSIDIGGRAYLRYNVDVEYEKLDGMETIVIEEFFRALVNNSFINLHINKNTGLNSHHIIEAIFKAFSIVLHDASRESGTGTIPSTKGLI